MHLSESLTFETYTPDATERATAATFENGSIQSMAEAVSGGRYAGDASTDDRNIGRPGAGFCRWRVPGEKLVK